MDSDTQDISFNFTDAQGRCYIAGTEVPREVYAEFEQAWSAVEQLNLSWDRELGEVKRLQDGIITHHRPVEFANGTDGPSPSCWVCVDDANQLMTWPCPTAALIDAR